MGQAPRSAVSAIAYVALGANLGDARATVSGAIQAFDSLPATRLAARSSLYASAPVDATGPDYVNAVVALSTQLPPQELLAQLQAMEQAAGRERPHPNAPRTLDLDILLYGDLRINTPTLSVPHPRMNGRAFVLVPLAQIAPHLVTPSQLQSVAATPAMANSDSYRASRRVRWCHRHNGPYPPAHKTHRGSRSVRPCERCSTSIPHCFLSKSGRACRS